LKAAVAANFMLPFKEIAAAFEAETGVKVEGTFSSTGSLYGQILNGAPYDVFLSADEKTPATMVEKGLGEKASVYAVGHLVLWGTGKDFCQAKDWREGLAKTGSAKIAIANPATAPYGAAAENALEKAGIWQEMQPRLVIAQNIGQAFQYAVTGGTAASFCALSSALSTEGRKGCHFLVTEAPPIRQAACLVSNSPRKKEAAKFLEYLFSPKAEAVKKRYGYS
jgi:molybdate transport system substrate-binding protein